MRVSDLMTTDLLTLNERDSLNLAHAEMSLARVRHLPVVRKGRLVGLVTHRDILRAMCSVFSDLDAVEQTEVLRNILVREIMSTDVQTIEPDAKASEAGRMLLSSKFGCLPVVVDGDQLVGIITEADFVELAVQHLDQLADARSRERGDDDLLDVRDDERDADGERDADDDDDEGTNPDGGPKW